MSNAALLSHFPRSIRLIDVWLVPSRRASSYCESPSCLRIALNCAAKLSWSLTSGTTLSDTSSSSEMPNTFESEALKAQSVAARTFAVAKIEKYEQKKPVSHPSAPICSSTHCQVYKTEKELKDCHPEGWAGSEEGFKKIQAACKATEG